jgi:uncharacterized membrane protein
MAGRPASRSVAGVDTATRHFPPGHLRVSDADRDRALAELSEHFQAGRLTAEEFDERSGRALQARTGAELNGLLADLPRPQTAVPAPVRPGPRAPARLPAGPIAAVVAVGAITAVLVIGAVTAGLNGGLGGHHGAAALVPVLIALLVVRRLAAPGRRRGYTRVDHTRRGRSADIHDD